MSDVDVVKLKGKQRFNHLIDVQIGLNNSCDSMNGIFEWSFFIHVDFASIITCFTETLLLIQTEFLVLIQFFSVLAMSFIHTFCLFWFSDKIEEEETKMS